MMRNKQAILAALFALSCAHHPQQARQEAVRRTTILMTGNRAGAQVVTRRENEVVIDYEYNDRGRGPKTHTVMRLDHALPVFLDTKGNDYLKQPIEEHFAIEGGMATWKNTSDSGTDKAETLYSSMYGPPEEAGLLAVALLRHGGTLPLAGGGRASIHKAGELTLHGTHVTAYELDGFGLSPLEVWLDDELHFFAAGGSWFMAIREGFEDDARAIIDAQNARERERGRQLVAKLTHRPRKDRLTVTNARVFDPRSGGVAEGMTIVVDGDRIVSVTKGTALDAQGEVIDARGKTVLPGLWDMHVHLGETDAILDIAAGITSVRDLGNDSDALLELKRKIDSGEAIGPRIVLAGLVDGRGPYQGPTKQLADTEEEARAVIDFFASRGYEGLKIYSSVKPELVPFMTRYAHEKGLRVSGHIPAGMTASQAIDAGYDEIQHANMLFLNFMPDVKETRTPARFTEVANRAADLDLSSAGVRAFIETLRTKRIVVDPTVNVFEEMFTARSGTISPGYAAVVERLPPQVRRALYAGGLPVPDGNDERFRASFRRVLDLVRAMHDAGVTIVAGTDAFAGFALHRELELYEQAGLPPAEILRIATLVPAQVLHRESDLGAIEAGKLADFIIVDGDPTRTVSDLRRVETVVKNGKVYDSRAVYAELGIH